MKNRILSIFVLNVLLATHLFATEVTLSKSIYEKTPFSSQFIEDGALIRNVNFNAVNALKGQIEQRYGLALQDRGEAHITVITPPEAQGWQTDHKGINYLISAIEIHQKYFPVLQDAKFEVLCIGRRKNDVNGNEVFYLVVKSQQLNNIRSEIQSELENRAKFTGMKTTFDAASYSPHITIGYVGGDVHGVSKGPETCDPELSLILRN